MSIVAIIPNYNHARFLEERLISVFRQSSYIDRIIILDDASTDDSLKIIEKFKASNVEIIVNKVNSGSVFNQWRKGLSIIQNDSLVWIAESDDVAHKDFLKESLKEFSNPEVVMTYVRSADIDESGKVIGVSYKNLKWADNSFLKKGVTEVRDHLYRQCTIPNVSAVVFRRNVIDNNYFEHNFKLCGDWYFYIRLLEKGKIAYISKVLNFHRFHQDTLRNKSVKRLDILNERLLIVTEICKQYDLNAYYYLSSMAFQIDLYISEMKISSIIGKESKKIFKLIRHYGFILIGVTIYLISKRILKRVLKYLK